jgi:hypothetical protein
LSIVVEQSSNVHELSGKVVEHRDKVHELSSMVVEHWSKVHQQRSNVVEQWSNSVEQWSVSSEPWSSFLHEWREMKGIGGCLGGLSGGAGWFWREALGGGVVGTGIVAYIDKGPCPETI